MDIVLISGLSGSGKSVALNALEDSGFYAVDNLPAALLENLIHHLEAVGCQKVAVAVDIRSGAGLSALPDALTVLHAHARQFSFIFLDAHDDTLIARFSETRRRHPLATEGISLAEAIVQEREKLEPMALLAHRIDTSHLKSARLRQWIRDFVQTPLSSRLRLMFQSFGFKYGLPSDADLVFDVRCLPNPHYDLALRPMTGLDKPVMTFLGAQPEVTRMANDISGFVSRWLPAYIQDGRSYLTVAIGCTGGQHRSVYLAEHVARHFEGAHDVLVRHRQISRIPV
jgi:RNase adapter protein RapZ